MRKRKIKTTNEKIDYICEKIKNIYDIESIKTLVYENKNLNAQELIGLYRKSWIAAGSHTINYWLQRGWPLEKAKVMRKKKANTMNFYPSPFSREFYQNKINPNTNKIYTDEEIEYKRNSLRPIKPEYWLEKGYDENEAIKKSSLTKIKNNKKGAKNNKNRSKKEHRNSSHRCKEYWMNRGYDEEQALFLVSKSQTTFSLQIAIEKYGPEEGYNIWKARQDKWQETLKNKSQKEIDEINSKKRSFSKGFIDEIGILYLISYEMNSEKYIKIGITFEDKLEKRHNPNYMKYKILYQYQGSGYEISYIENHVVLKLTDCLIKEKVSGYTETFYADKISKNEILKEIEIARNSFRDN